MKEDEEQLTKRPRITANYSIRYFASYAWRRTKKKYPQYTRADIHRAIVLYFELAQEDLAKGEKIKLVNKLGNLYLTKEERGVTYNAETGKITNTLPVNIGESSKLWKQKPELKNKIFVRFTNEHSQGFLFRLKYELSSAIYKNKLVYDFKFSRTLKKKLVENIKNKNVDAYLIPKKNE